VGVHSRVQLFFVLPVLLQLLTCKPHYESDTSADCSRAGSASELTKGGLAISMRDSSCLNVVPELGGQGQVTLRFDTTGLSIYVAWLPGGVPLFVPTEYHSFRGVERANTVPGFDPGTTRLSAESSTVRAGEIPFSRVVRPVASPAGSLRAFAIISVFLWR
jgi:hypothetical protein